MSISTLVDIEQMSPDSDSQHGSREKPAETRTAFAIQRRGGPRSSGNFCYRARGVLSPAFEVGGKRCVTPAQFRYQFKFVLAFRCKWQATVPACNLRIAPALLDASSARSVKLATPEVCIESMPVIALPPFAL